jgi:hypothetical protein
MAQWAHGKNGGNEDLRCQVGTSSSPRLVPAREIIRSRLVSASNGKHFNWSQTVTSSRVGEPSRPQFVILKVRSGWRDFSTPLVQSNLVYFMNIKILDPVSRGLIDGCRFHEIQAEGAGAYLELN